MSDRGLQANRHPHQIEKLARTDGTTDRGRQPRLAAWEVPRRDPAEPRPNAPDVAVRRGIYPSICPIRTGRAAMPDTIPADAASCLREKFWWGGSARPMG